MKHPQPLLGIFLALLAGCTTYPAPQQVASPVSVSPAPPVTGKAEVALDEGVRKYDEGQYDEAAGRLQQALELGLATPRDRARAHKYLAFIHCISGRDQACRDDFRNALIVDPGFDLTTAEIGHPMWGPVYRSVRAEAGGAAPR